MSSSRAKFFLRAIVSLGLIVLVLRKVRWSELAVVLRQLDPTLAAVGSSLTLLLILLLATRWRIFLRQQGLDLTFIRIFTLTWAGQFFNSVLPGSTGGDVVKIYQLCQLHPDRKAAAAATVFADRLSALVALLALAGTAVLVEPAPLGLIEARGITWKHVAGILAALAAAGAAGAWLTYRLLRRTTLFGRISRTVIASRRAFVLSFETVMAVFLAFALHLLNFTIIFFFAKALGLRITYGQVLLIMPVVLLLVMLPVTVNGHGLRELLLIGYFTALGIRLASGDNVGTQEMVVALSIVIVSNDLLWSLPGGLWYLLRRGERKWVTAS